MPQIFNEKNISFQLRQAPIPEFAWHTSPKLAEIVKSKHLHFQEVYEQIDRVDYYKGEDKVSEKWANGVEKTKK